MNLGESNEKSAKRAKRTFAVEVPLSFLLHSRYNEKIRSIKERFHEIGAEMELCYVDEELPPIYYFLIQEDRNMESFYRPYLGSKCRVT